MPAVVCVCVLLRDRVEHFFANSDVRYRETGRSTFLPVVMCVIKRQGGALFCMRHLAWECVPHETCITTGYTKCRGGAPKFDGGGLSD